jgi:hypothetical protein
MPAEIAMAAFIVAAVWLVSWPIAAIHFRDKRLLGDRVIVTTERLWD